MNAADSGFKGAVHERVERFAALRNAQRALAPSLRDADQLFPPDQVRDMLARLRALAQSPGSEAEPSADGEEPTLSSERTAALDEVDGLLQQVGSRIVEALDSVSLAQLRATLPATATTYPEEVLALLNLCASHAAGNDPRLRVAEYMLTLLSSEMRDGVRSLVRDPDKISPVVMALGAAQREKLNPRLDPEDAALQFRAAAAYLQENEEIQTTLEQVRALKFDLGEGIFLSEVLNDAVAYNIAVWNRQEELLDEERTSDRIAEADLLFSTEIEFEDEELEEGRETEAEPEPQEEAHSVEEVARSQEQGIAQVEQAIALRVRGEEAVPGLLGLMVLELDPATLGDSERKAYQEDSDDPAARLIRAIIATAVVLQQLPEGAERLQEIGLAQAALQGDWIRHLSQEVQRVMRTLVASSSYEEARGLSAIKHKYLYASLTQLIRERAQEAGMGKGSSQTAIEGGREAIERAALPTISKQRIVQELKRPANYVGLLIVILLISLVGRVALVRPRPIQLFTKQELALISPFLTAGYRGKDGASPLFIGKLRQEWNNITVEEQRAEGETLAKELRYSGVNEIMLYDDARRLQFHIIGGEIRVPKPPEE